MRTRLLFIQLFLIGSLSQSGALFAQVQVADSLLKLVDKAPTSLEKAALLNQISLSLTSIDIKMAKQRAIESVEQAKASGNNTQLAWSMLSEAICSQIAGENTKAEKLFIEILELNKTLKNVRLQGYIVNLQANQLRDEGFFDEALKSYEDARAIMARENDEEFQIISKLELTRLYLILNELERATREIDAALSMLSHYPGSSMKREAFLLKGRVLLQNFNYSSAEEFLNKAEALSEPNSSSYLRVQFSRGEILFLQGDFSGAIAIWKGLLDAEKEIGYQYDLAMLLLNLAEAYSEQGYRKIAIEYLNACLATCDRSGFNFVRSETTFELAWIDYRNGDFTNAKQKVNDSELHYKKANLSIWIAACNNLRGLIYMGRNKLDSSLFYHNKALDIRLKSNRPVAISSSLFNMGELFVNRKEYSKALEYLHRGLTIDESINDNYGKSLYYYQLSRAHQGQKRQDSVEYYLTKTINLAVPNSAYEILRKSYLDMATFLQNTGKTTEAINFLEKYITIGDSLYNKQTTQTLAAYETLFEVDKKAKEIELLNKDKELAEANNRMQKLLLYALGLGFIFLIGLALFYRQTGARLKVLNQANEEKAKELLEANNSLKKIYTDLQANNTELKETLNKLRQAQDQLLKSEKMASLGVLAAGVAHELNNPLNFIKGGITTLEIQASKDGKLDDINFKKSLDIIHEGVNRASVILKGLGQYSRQSEKINEVCDLNKILDNCLTVLSNNLKYHVNIVRQYSQDPVVIQGNEGKIHQVFINILSNAEQAIQGEGTITIMTRKVGASVEVSISDTGIGISAENLKRLGDLFFTTKDPGKGTGLGLSISYKIIEEHGGKIKVESVLGKGTTFLITF